MSDETPGRRPRRGPPRRRPRLRPLGAKGGRLGAGQGAATPYGRGLPSPARSLKSSGAHPDDRDPQLLDSAMKRMISQHGWELDLRVQAVFGRWAELVGEEVASHCTPESLAETRLIVRTDSTARATQLKLLTPTIVKRLNVELGDGIVTVIDIRGPHLPNWKKGRFTTRDGRGPRDTYG
ncbi:DUF721 domain-containing protein [Nocardioides sp. B-3]|uniref:DUF721 domain-containing protein n=1 Tax=Nocardioides sp. B-3 TaxID=2895565 RepID=UPI0021529196|nr:DciA family protein [Nocardioides sp. B-3]UUZ61091.1 DciA family protein [Nocardioides sp. B-3]